MATREPAPPGKRDIDACRRCPLWERATQGVAGEGAHRPKMMLVGEQPGDEEDRQGKPFVGPAGRLLRQAVSDAGISADDIYVTNAVKHFSWEPRGKRRIHKTPTQREVAACRDWLESEIGALRPVVIVALGATAIGAVLGRRVGVGEGRAMTLQHEGGVRVIATYHPSAILRAIDEARRSELYELLVGDLKRAREAARRNRA